MASRGRRPHTVSLSIPRADTGKCSHIKEGQETAAALVPTPVMIDPPLFRGVKIEGSSPQKWFGEYAAYNEALRSPSLGGSRGTQQATQLVAGEASVNTQARAVDFLEANLLAKSVMVESLAQSWALTPSSPAEPPKVTEE